MGTCEKRAILIHHVFIGGVYTSILIFVAGLPARQSVVLAFIFTVLVYRLGELAPKPILRLRPYRVSVTPDYYRILGTFTWVRGNNGKSFKKISTNRPSTSRLHLAIWDRLHRSVSQSEDGETHFSVFRQPQVLCEHR